MNKVNQKKNGVMVVIALLLVYLLWGSTYLAIKIAIEDFPPFFMAGTRNLIAGAIMFGAATIFMKSKKAGLKQWLNAAMVGTGLLLLGNGGVVWAEQKVPSGIAALFIATEPIWIIILSSFGKGKGSVSKIDLASISLGFLGVILLVSQNFTTNNTISLAGVVALLIASFSWAVGSVIMQNRFISDNSVQSTGMIMISGGVLLMIASGSMGEFSGLNLTNISNSSLMAYFYLITFGSLVGFSAYTWLLSNTTIALASTYAFVNPVVAVLLGFLIAHEKINAQIISASFVIVLSVILIVMKNKIAEMKFFKRA